MRKQLLANSGEQRAYSTGCNDFINERASTMLAQHMACILLVNIGLFPQTKRSPNETN